jgi:hypothetical protein
MIKSPKIICYACSFKRHLAWTPKKNDKESLLAGVEVLQAATLNMHLKWSSTGPLLLTNT